MDEWVIRSFTGVGPVRFGMTRAASRTILGDAYSPQRKGSDAYDEWSDLGLHLYYDKDGLLELIEAWGPSPVQFGGISLLQRDVQELREELAKLGLAVRHDDQCYFFDSAGFAIYAPDDIVLTVSVYRRGYYEQSTNEQSIA